MTLNRPIIYFIIPVFNEEPNIPHLFRSFQNILQAFQNQFRLHFIIIDDGSTDETVNEAVRCAKDSNLEHTILSHAKNLGPGKAFQTAFEHLAPILNDQDWVVTLEGDNTSRIELLKQMFQRSEEGYEVVFASPYAYGGAIINTSLHKVILSSIANTFVKEVLGVQGIHTVSSFFRLYQAAAIKKLQRCYGDRILEKDGFECMLEMLMKMINLQITISEVPMILDTKKRYGKSKMKILKTIMAYFSLGFEKKKWAAMARVQPRQVLETTRCAEDLR